MAYVARVLQLTILFFWGKWVVFFADMLFVSSVCSLRCLKVFRVAVFLAVTQLAWGHARFALLLLSPPSGKKRSENCASFSGDFNAPD